MLAAATALIGAQLLQAAGVVALDKSMYLAPRFNWFGHIVGGLIFGFGMVFAGGCPSRNLARAGGGDLRSLLTLMVLGLVAYMAIGGLFAPVRAALEQRDGIRPRRADPGHRRPAGALDRASRRRRRAGHDALLAAAALAYCFADQAFRTSPVHVVSGLAVGLIGRRRLGADRAGLRRHGDAARVPPISLTYVRPDGRHAAMAGAASPPRRCRASAWPACSARCSAPAAAALAMGRFRLATFSDTGDTLRNLVGAALMGVGGVMALGCTVGQAITGVSTLALGSFLTFAAIVAGGFCGLRLLERWIMAGA